VKFHLNRFLRRVRIHGGEFDTSARAMYREGVTRSLRADLRIVRGSTIERKQMSTKTTFKRIALVTVAALGFGVMSVAPSSAVINADTLTLSAATAAQNTAETATATSATATLAFLGTAGADSASVTVSLVSGPAGSTALPFLSLAETASATIDSSTAAAKPVGSITAPNTAAVVWAAGSGTVAASAKFSIYVGNDSRTAPAKAGTYVVKVTPASVGGSGALQGATAQTLTITVTAAPTLDTVAASGTTFLRAAEDSATATTDAVVTASKDIPTSSPGTAAVANIQVTLKNAAGTTLTTSVGESYTATIAGPGTLGSGVWNSSSNLLADARGRALTVRIGDAVAIYPDGNSGVATVTISTSAGIVVGTEKVTFFGAATSIVATAEATVLNPNVANNGDGADVTTRPIKVVVKDAAGTSVSNATLYVTSETTTIVSDKYATTGMCSYDSDSSAYFCKLNALVAGKTNITVGTKSSATDTTVGAIEAAKVAVRVGTTTPASVKVTTDKTSYAPGEKATITVQLLDADGNVNADGVYSNIFATGGISSDFVLGSTSDTLTATGVVTPVTGTAAIAGKATYNVYMPQNTGEITFTYKTAGTAVTGTAPSALSGLAVANQAVTSTFKVSVSNPGVDAAAAAAEEATAAANDATDAALSAAEAAEAATAMAQEAVDAVAELSASVTKLISALRAQITTLTNLVVKIQKKVKA